ncbi:hypothetical protein mRhiFer1_009124 [Rhinolophus ferrumequinum]|uniref:RNase H type-1 domain-containing protein n=1 Tax=Rhinolophus ferrumequinum TaxID=59479 RepID=A0A7J7SJ67_RHIFE|nr:hypothetical protein mRhiFer1_009124 [Rhinolophus ferrumequinum]
MIDLMESIFHTHHPTWEDCQQLLRTLFNTEERRRIIQGARQWLEEVAPGGVLDAATWATEAAPDARPDWDFNTEAGSGAIRQYQDALLGGLRAGSRKPTNMSKTADVTKNGEKTPGDFYERLCEAFRVNTPLDSEAPENQRMINTAFVSQAAPDIRRKLQKLEGFAGMNITQLLEVANKVNRNSEVVAKQEADKRMREKGFKNSPTLFGEALASDLATFPREEYRCTLLQYVDDLLLAYATETKCQTTTWALLSHLAKMGYRVSWKKAQLCRKQVQYLGFVISKGQWALSTEWKKVITSLPRPTNRRALCEFLGAAGFCRIWIPGFSAIAQPLFKALAGQEKAPIIWTEDQENAFQQLKSSLGQTPALGLPDAERPFHLFVHERDKTPLELLAQTVGPWLRPTAYLSKKLDPVAAGWSPCLRTLAATVILIKEADKLTLGHRLIVKVPHSVATLMNRQGPRWLSNAQLTQYQGLLLENPRISLETVCTLNPATFLPTEDGDPEQDCIEVINEVYATRPDLRDSPHPNPDLTLYTDGGSFLRDGKRHAGYAVTTTDEVLEAGALPVGWSAQRAELWALIRALTLSEGRKVNTYTDSRYAFATVHIHGAIYKERGLLTAERKTTKNKQEILKLRQAIWLPQQVAVIHCRGRQRGNEPSAVGNRLADTMAKSAVMGSRGHWHYHHIPPARGTQKNSDGKDQKEPPGCYKGGSNDLTLLGPQITAEYHKLTHLGKIALEGLLAKNYISRLSALCKSIRERCLTCAKNNPKSGPSPIPGIQRSGAVPFEDLKVDFTNMTSCRGIKYLLVLVCTYSRLSQELKDDMDRVADSLATLQSQLNSLAAVALQNRRALDLLTAEKGGTCLFLGEECCYLVNQ